MVLESLHQFFSIYPQQAIVLKYQIQHKFLPVQKIKSKKDTKNWITKEIKRENTKKHNLYKFFLQNQTEAAKHLHQKHCRKKSLVRH